MAISSAIDVAPPAAALSGTMSLAHAGSNGAGWLHRRRRLLAKSSVMMPANAAVAMLLALAVVGSLRVASAAEWPDTRQVDNIIFRADFSLANYGSLFTELTSLRGELERTLGIPTSHELIEVYLFSKQAAYAMHLKQLLGQAPNRRALYVKRGGRGRVYVYESSQLGIDLRHECTHAFLHAALPEAPLWLDEGLAEYFEPPAGERAFDNPYLSVVCSAVTAWEHAPPIERLENRQQLEEMTAADYRVAWSWTHFMLHGPRAGHEALVEYLDDLARRRRPTPLSERLRSRMPDLELQYVRHFKRWQQK